MTSHLVLYHYNPDLPLILSCDASNKGLGCVLSQILKDDTERPISYASRMLTKPESKYSVIHKEALAIYWGVRKFFQYLAGRKFTLVSDHRPLLALFGENKALPVMAAGRLQRWAAFLSEFDYEFRHVEGHKNVGADSLSRLPLNVADELTDSSNPDYLNFIERQLPINALQIRSATRTDIVLGKVCNYINNGWPIQVEDELKPFAVRKNELSIDQGIIMWGYRVVIPEKLRKPLLEQLHTTHMGICKTKSLARAYFWYPNLDRDIENMVKSCGVCMSMRSEPEKVNLIKWKETNRVFERVHLDFLGRVNGRSYLILTDSYSKWPEVFEMKKIDTSCKIEKLRETFARYGLSEKIVTDNGTAFTSSSFSVFFVLEMALHM